MESPSLFVGREMVGQKGWVWQGWGGQGRRWVDGEGRGRGGVQGQSWVGVAAEGVGRDLCLQGTFEGSSVAES
ncbi:hypothetical protein L6452_13655 [Arctium lappa]|uniref:Uncharacterized protein n=1 Tax=Arctium lappa TaxID=4217 RepID=A0ACB9CIS9_ARCLA|nr:hypothetical protein L6452_13655 [Arctium lappa]